MADTPFHYSPGLSAKAWDKINKSIMSTWRVRGVPLRDCTKAMLLESAQHADAFAKSMLLEMAEHMNDQESVGDYEKRRTRKATQKL